MEKNQQPTFCKSVCPWASKQLTQPSTWRGLIALAGAFGVFGAPEHAQTIIAGITAVLGLGEVVRDESK